MPARLFHRGIGLLVLTVLVAGISGCQVAAPRPASATAPAPTATLVGPAGSPTATRTAAPSATLLAIVTPTRPGLTAELPTASTTLPAATATFTPGPPSPGIPPPPGAASNTAPPPMSTATPMTTAVPLAIHAFTAEPAQIRPGEAVTLTWRVSAEAVTIYRLDLQGRLGEFFNVPLTGTLAVSTPPEQRQPVQFMLFAVSGGSSAQAAAGVTVTCPDVWFFASAPATCPAWAPRPTVMQAQQFERGRMLWTQVDDRITILYTDGQSPAWEIVANGWLAGTPEAEPALEPPPGLYQPVRGFGVAWRTGYAGPDRVVRDRIGWALEPEHGVAGAYGLQCEALAKYARCFISGPGGLTFVLEPERSGWAANP